MASGQFQARHSNGSRFNIQNDALRHGTDAITALCRNQMKVWEAEQETIQAQKEKEKAMVSAASTACQHHALITTQ